MTKDSSEHTITFNDSVTEPIHTGSGDINVYNGEPRSASLSANLPVPKKLRRLISNYFSVGERRIICFDLGFNDHSLAGQTHEEKVVALIEYCSRNQLLTELIACCQEERPFLDWPII